MKELRPWKGIGGPSLRSVPALDMFYMFNDLTLSTANYDAILIGWEAQDVQYDVRFDGGDSQYSPGAAAEARQRLIDFFDWQIVDGGEVE